MKTYAAFKSDFFTNSAPWTSMSSRQILPLFVTVFTAANEVP